MKQEQLLQKFSRVERTAKASRFRRMLNHPLKYFLAIGFRAFFPNHSLLKRTKLFFGKKFFVLLPSATDIFITGGKAEDSELRLTKFLIKKLTPGDCFIDIGAHFGFYSLLAAECVGIKGSVFSFEASPKNFEILKMNVAETNVQIFNNVISEIETDIEFFEFSPMYSEYNSMYPAQYENQVWFKKSKKNAVKVPSIRLDQFIEKHELKPSLIKIDVEGSEYDVLLGFEKNVKDFKGSIIMEYLSPKRNNLSHRKAVQFLISCGFKSFIITNEGKAELCENIEEHLIKNKLQSDNIVFNSH